MKSSVAMGLFVATLVIAAIAGAHSTLACEPGSNGCPLDETPPQPASPETASDSFSPQTDSLASFCEPGSNGCP